MHPEGVPVDFSWIEELGGTENSLALKVNMLLFYIPLSNEVTEPTCFLTKCCSAVA